MERIISSIYPIIFCSDYDHVVFNLFEILLRDYKSSKKFVLVDENSQKFCLEKIRNKHLSDLAEIVIKSGEKNKNVDTLSYVWEHLTTKGADRNSLLINLGGGVIGDLGGFAAATYKRGIDFINVPTTLLSMVDAAVGGKVGIDFTTQNGLIYKNFIGGFHTPKAVLISPKFLQTLPQNELLSGWAEIIKHGLALDKGYWKKIKKISADDLRAQSKHALEKLIYESVVLKNKVVLKDPKETGLRKVLNFGHTVGHAIEGYSLKHDKIPLLHGEAVAIGMVCEAYLSMISLGMKLEKLQEITSAIREFYRPYKINPLSFKEIISLMKRDKKNSNGKINFSLLSEIGKCKVDQFCDENLIMESLKYYLKTFNNSCYANEKNEPPRTWFT